MAGRSANYAEVLVEMESPIALYKHLVKYWAVTDTPPEDPGGRATRSTADPATGAVAAVWIPVLETLQNLVLWKVDGVDKLSLLVINSVREVSVLHSLFYIVESAGDFTAGDLFAIWGEIPAAGLSVVLRLEPLLFAANFPFVGTPRLEFTDHLSGLKSSLPQEFEDIVHQVADREADEGARRVQSQGLAFVSRATAAAALEAGPLPAITDVLCCTFEALSQEDKVFDRALDWMQASFTTQSEGTYVG